MSTKSKVRDQWSGGEIANVLRISLDSLAAAPLAYCMDTFWNGATSMFKLTGECRRGPDQLPIWMQ